METNRQFIKSLIARTALILGICIALTILFDPLFQYHQPLPQLKAVLTDKEYQVVGSLKTFDYDSVIVGSSVAENYNNAWFNQGFDCTSIKAIRTYGATADLCFLLDIAFAEQDLKYVFYNCDTSSLDADPVLTYELTGAPTYLYDNSYLNDLQYLLNKDILMEKTPFLIASSFIGDYNEDESYNWSHWKSFSQTLVLSNYLRKPTINPMLEETAYQQQLDGNLLLLTTCISKHPETRFKIFFPPYSMLYWDNIYRNGKTDAYLYNMEQTIETLLAYDNVDLYYFQAVDSIVCDLNNYMDALHFSQEINYWMYEQMLAGNYRVTKENYHEVLSDMRSLVRQIVEVEILPLESSLIYDISDNGERLF
ncbi:MAG: SGNH/GDSL hydrolase family protein [Lachnospiraceae bacterium]|nr:SGNH/GDSL hydrolase family protein [Lachnospiraceae bacterium]